MANESASWPSRLHKKTGLISTQKYLANDSNEENKKEVATNFRIVEKEDRL